MNRTIRVIEKQLNLTFNKPELIQQAFRHTSYANEQARRHLPHYERLEFLGDAVLELLSSEFLYHSYPNLPEGKLTRMRAQIRAREELGLLGSPIKI